MLTFEEAEVVLFELADELPQEILKGLNCGISLTYDAVYDVNGLCILGTYHYEPMGLGRYITIHYGSILAVRGYMPPGAWREELKRVLYHELIHHLEHQAGDKSLEIQDKIDKARYLFGR